MIILKIALQVVVGAAALLTVYLDYKWYDKRKKEFKNGRNWLISFLVLILGGSITITIIDENKKNKETEKLSSDLAAVQDSLSTIKEIGIKLNNQIEPILKLAKERYPNLPVEEAIKKVETDIEELQEETKFLQQNEAQRKIAESNYQNLKNTPPKFDAELEIKDDKLNLIILPQNQVPIKFTYQLFNDKNQMIIPMLWSSQEKVYPRKGYKGDRLNIGKLDQLEEISTDKDQEILLVIGYESVYFPEVPNDKLTGTFEKKFILNVSKKEVSKKL